MSGADALLLRYAATRPDEVAALMGGQPQSEVAGIVASLPTPVASAVAARLSSHTLRQCLAALDPAVIGDLLLASTGADRLAILSHLATGAEEAILQSADPERRPALARLFRMPPRSLSALAQPDFIRVEAAETCGALKAELASREADPNLPIFALDAEARYLGLVPPLAVLAEMNADRQVSEILEAVPPLRGSTPIPAALAAPQWSRSSVLPVVDGNGHVLGALTREQLDVSAHSRDAAGSLGDLFGVAVTGYFGICAELLELAIGTKRP
ncbi:MAG: hypothetical protein R3233_01740 [Xanthomonadales bacterium]|nr:hypothetical protein [Xanthomonadales bacterium]